MKKSVKDEFVKLVKSINKQNRNLLLGEDLLVRSSCFDKSVGEYSLEIKSGIIHSFDFEEIYALVSKYECHFFFHAIGYNVYLDIQ